MKILFQYKKDARTFLKELKEFYEAEETEPDEPMGSANYLAAIAKGMVVGSPRYAHSVPHHQYHGYGSWTYEEMYHPAEELALQWFADDKPIMITGLWVVWQGKDPYAVQIDDPCVLRVDRGDIVDDVLSFKCKYVLDVTGFDVEGDEESEWLNATICSHPDEAKRFKVKLEDIRRNP